MSAGFALSIDILDYEFSKSALPAIGNNLWVKNQWPLIYFLQNQGAKIGYVGESVNALNRINAHLDDPQRSIFRKISVVGSDKFNKSATLTIESQLIQHIVAEGSFKLQNGNNGLTYHNFYQRSEYDKLFEEIWSRLQKKNIVQKNLDEIRNSEYFKYSPYKSLNQDQHNSILEIIKLLNARNKHHIFVNGCAGTGKTILATYLIKLLTSNYEDLNTEGIDEDGIRELELMREFKSKYPNPKIGLVVAMQSFRATLQEVFEQIPGLKKTMVIAPSDVVKEKYDILLVDEAHRLRQQKNISWRGAFRKNNTILGFGDDGTELDWILTNSTCQIFFYDASQSVRPSDVPGKRFNDLMSGSDSSTLELKKQMRVKAGNDYITFIDDVLNCRIEGNMSKFDSDEYELKVFGSFKDLYNELEKKEQKFKQCRLVAGFAWPWFTKKNKSEDAYDIEIEGMRFWWNREPIDWVNSPTAFEEVGCIHTIQGYDLNYAGVIFGKEITYNPSSNRIEIIAQNYCDQFGKAATDPVELHEYVINIYKTLMYRGAYGTFVYACDENLSKYLRDMMHPLETKPGIVILPPEKVRPYKNCVPLYNLKAAAGALSEPQDARQIDWVELPDRYTPSPDYFVCQVKGESMNRKIPNGSYCLFRKDLGGSRAGKIVLVQHRDIQDTDNGAGFTVKEYSSKKTIRGDRAFPEKIILKPLSDDPVFEDIVFTEETAKELKVVGIFVAVL